MNKFVLKLSILTITFMVCISHPVTVWSTEPSSTDYDNLLTNPEWKLKIDGLVDKPVNLTLSQIVAMSNTKVDANLYCFSDLVYSGEWYGVKLGDLLKIAGLRSGIAYIQFVASDGYTIFLDASTAMRDDVIVACELNGQPLREFLRLVIPGENGDRWIALITQIIAVETALNVSDQTNSQPTIREAAKSVALADQIRDSNSMGNTTTGMEQTTQEPIEPELEHATAMQLIIIEAAIIAVVAFAVIIGAVRFWTLRKQK